MDKKFNEICKKIDTNKINNYMVQYKVLQNNKKQTYLITSHLLSSK